MTTIKATCPACGEVALTPEEIELMVHSAGQNGASYAFTCPTCLGLVRKPADDRIVRLLVSGGVQVIEAESADIPAEVLEHPVAAPALTYDDLLDLHELLASDDWYERLLAEHRR